MDSTTRYQHGGYELVEVLIDRYVLTITTKELKGQVEEKYFAEWWKRYFHERRLNAVTVQALEDARQRLLKTVVAEGKNGVPDKLMTSQRVNRYMAWLRYMLNGVMGDGKLPSNAVVKLKMFEEPKGKTRFLSMKEEAILLNKLGPVQGAWARFAILTGLRLTQQFRLQWADVDLERGVLTLSTTKAGGVQYAHLNDEAKAILRSLDSWQRSKWVFPSKNPATPVDTQNFLSLCVGTGGDGVGPRLGDVA